MIKIKLYGNREESAAMADQIGKMARIRKGPKFFPDNSGAEKGETYLEAEIEGAEKEAAERERAEKIREKVLDFIAEIKKARIPITFIADDLTRYIALFRVFGITNGREKYILEILSSELDEEIKKIEAEGQA